MEIKILDEIEKGFFNNTPNFGDFIFDLVKEFYDNALLSNLKPKENEWSVFSSVILQNENLFKVITFANGTKSLPNKNYFNRDFRVFDSHGEILAMKSLKHFLVKLLAFNLIKKFNIENTYLTKEEFETFELNFEFFDIFEFYKNEKVLLKKNIYFHLYISELPCGDCTIVPIKTKDKLDNQQTGSKVVELFNTKTDLIKLPHDNTKGKCRSKSMRSDIDRENISYSLSCSDKLLFKNILGLQGKLLARLMEVVYLSSVIISNSTKEDQFEYINAILSGMCVHRRGIPVNGVSLNSLGYFLNEPRVYLVDKYLARGIGCSLSHSAYWYYGKITFTKIDPIIGFKQGTINKPKSLEKSRVDLCLNDFVREYLVLLKIYSENQKLFKNNHFEKTVCLVNEYFEGHKFEIYQLVDNIESRFYKYVKDEFVNVLKISEFLEIKKQILNKNK
jgi:hypothetical protein